MRHPRFASISTVAILGLLATCGCSGQAAAQSARLGMTTTHPRGVDAALIERNVTVTIDENGRQSLRDQRQWEILTDYALDYHSDPEVIFDGARQELDVANARTTQPDGTVTETPESGVNELLPHALHAAPAYGSIRRTVITMVGVEPGGRAELDYTISDQQPTAWAAGGAIALASPMPATKVQLAIDAAQGTLRSACVRCDATPTANDAGERAHHGYELTELEATNTYELGYHVGDNGFSTTFLPRVVYSTAESWVSEARALSGRVTAAAQATPALRERTETLLRDEATLWSRVETLQAFVATAVDTVHLDLHQLGYAPAAAEEVLNRSYGSELEKAVLLVALLRTLDIDSTVALVSQESQIAEDIPWLGQLDHVWVIVEAGGQMRWMPVDRPLMLAENELPGQSFALRLDQIGGPRELPLPEPSTSALRAVGSVRISADGELGGDIRATFGGTRNPYFRLRATKRAPTSLLRPIASQLAAGVSVDDPAISCFGPSGTDVRGSLTGQLEAEGDGSFMAIDIPWPEDGISDVDLRQSRMTPLALSGPRVTSLRFTIDHDAGWALADGPEAIELRNDVGWLIQTITERAGGLEITRELGVHRRVVEPGEEYEQLHALVTAANRIARQSVILRASPTAEDEAAE